MQPCEPLAEPTQGIGVNLCLAVWRLHPAIELTVAVLARWKTGQIHWFLANPSDAANAQVG
jgi:hypothetical protein